jgi:hypothetical protein
VKEGLEKMGFTQVDVKQGAGGYTAKAMKDGQPVTLNIDPSGAVTRR